MTEKENMIQRLKAHYSIMNGASEEDLQVLAKKWKTINVAGLKEILRIERSITNHVWNR